MSVLFVPRRRFRWRDFSWAITTFAVTHGLEEAFPVVDDGSVVFWRDHDELSLELGLEAWDVPADPLDRLKAGFTLFVSFTAHQGFRRVACADGGVIAVPDIEVDDDGSVLPPDRDELRRLVEKTECDECRAYGFLISLDAGKLALQTALMADADGECHVEGVEEAGLADEPMTRFVSQFARGRKPL